MADIVISDAAPNAAIDDLIGKIVSLDKMKTLFAIADMGKFVSQQETPNPTINRWNLSVFAHLLITRRSSQHTHVPTGDELTHICRLISGIPQYAKSGLVNPKGEPVVAHGTILAALLRTAFSQFPLNIRHLQEIARNYLLIDSDEYHLPDFDLSKVYDEFFGYPHIAGFSFIFSVFTNKSVILKLTDYLKETKVSQRDIEAFLGKASLQLDQYPDRFDSDSKYHDPNPVNEFNILRDFPIIRLDADVVIAPIPIFLFFLFHNHIYYSLVEHFAQAERFENPRNPNAYDNKFSQRFGILLEKYVSRLAHSTYDNESLINEYTYDKDSKKSPEIIIKEKCAILVQVKNKRVRLDAQKTGNIEIYKEELEKAIIKPIVQNVKFLENPSNCLSSKLGYAPTEFISLVVTPEPFPYNYMSDFKGYIDSRVKHEIGNRARLKGVDCSRWYAVSLYELEFVLAKCLTGSVRLQDFFDEYDDHLATGSLKTPRKRSSSQAGAHRMKFSLGDFLVAQKNANEEIRHPLLAEAWQRAMRDMLAFFFDKEVIERRLKEATHIIDNVGCSL